MKKFLLALALTACALSVGADALAQASTPAAGQAQADPGITPNGVIGEVAAIDAAAKQAFVKTDAGSVVIVALADNTMYLRLPPGETTLTKATKITLADISAGDRVFARGTVAADTKSMTARIVIVNTKSDLEQKHEADRAEWRRRGIVGVITALNPATKEITLQSRAPGSAPSVIIAAADSKVKFRRHAPDSVRFSDAKPGTFDELKVGDQLRAKGDKSEDGTRFTPEEIVTGSFRTLMGTITAINPETKEIKINTLQGNQPVTVVVSKDSSLKRVPPEAAAMMAGGPPPGGGAPGAGAPPPQGQPGGAPVRRIVTPGGGAPPEGAGGGGTVVRRMGGDMQEMIERLPAATLAELKPGSMVVFSTTGTGAERVTAIQLIAGIEPLVAAMQARAGGGRPGGGGASLANLNLGFGIGQP